MKVVSRLHITGTNEFAVMINDEGEEYPVFLESLHNTVMFPLMLESGYELVKLPYGFVKDGVNIMDLPVVEYSPTDAILESMYEGIGIKLPDSELKSKISVNNSMAYMATPPTNYTITTREEFLEYLDATEKVSDIDDFKPLNYFVAPEARFTIDEFRGSKYTRYIHLIESRRRLSIQKFDRLVQWLHQFGLGNNYTAIDVLDAYFAWGIDGVNVQFISKRRETRNARLSANKNVRQFVTRKTQGFVDGRRNMLTPLNQRDVAWEPVSKDPSFLQDITRGLAVDETVPCEFQCRTTMDVTVLEGVDFNVTYCADTLMMLQQTYTTLFIISPVDASRQISLQLALPTNREELQTYCALMAEAELLYKMRRSKEKTCSYDALRVAGANPRAALDYITTKAGLVGDINKAPTTDDVYLYWKDIPKFLAGEELEDEKVDYLEQILEGVLNIDSIQWAKDREAVNNIDSVFNELYAVHYVFGVPIEDIYKAIVSITPDQKELVFTGRGVKHTMNASRMEFTKKAYLKDLQQYELENANTCANFTYVTCVAREVGVIESDRHVGIEFYMVTRTADVNRKLQEISSMFEEEVEYKVVQQEKRDQIMKFRASFILSAFFEIALKGTLTFPKVLGARKVDMHNKQLEYAKHLVRKIESTVGYCDFTVVGSNASDMSFNLYCVNAYITPEYVIPRKGVTIHEAPFMALWSNYANTNPDIYAQLVAMGVLPAGFEAWEVRYYNEQFVQRDLMELNNEDSLMRYAEQAVESIQSWPADKDFKAVPHPVEYIYPGLCKDTNNEAYVPIAPRDGLPVARIGNFRDITFDNYSDKVLPLEIQEEPSQYVRPFKGFDAEGFVICPDILTKMPDQNKRRVVVLSGGYLYIPETGNTIDFTRLEELSDNYAYVHVYGRHYLLLDAGGKLWEVCI